MDIPDWLDKILSEPVAIATLVLALVTAVLAGGAFWAIWQNYKFREKDRKERLLNEIIEWAIDIANWRPKEVHKDIDRIREDITALPGVLQKGKEQELMGAHIGIIMDSLIRMRGRNQYARSIAMKLDKTLKKFVDKLVKEIESHIELLYEWETIITSATARGAVVDDTEEFNNAEYKEDFLEELASEVIEEDTKIKTKDIA